MQCGGSGQVWAPDPIGTGGQVGGTTTTTKPQKVVIRPPVEQGPIKNYEGAKFLFMRHGQGRAEHTNGFVYEGRWLWGKWSGKGTLTWPDNWIYAGAFSAGIMSGKGRLDLVNGVAFEGKFRRGIPKGKGIAYFTNGVRIEGRWSGCETANVKLFDSAGKPVKARIQGGIIQIKEGFFSKWKIFADFNMRTILTRGVSV
jgi:hypothetical protein